MARPAYRAAPGNDVILIFLTLLTIVAMVVMVPVLGPGPRKDWHTILYFSPALLTITIGYLVVTRRQRRRMASLEQAFGTLNYKLVTRPSPEERQHLWSLIGFLASDLDIIGGAGKIQWLARPNHGEEKAWIFETQHTTHNGKNTRIHHRTILAWPDGNPGLPGTHLGHEPGFLMSRLSWLDRRAVKKDELDHLGFQGLKHRWSIHGNAETGCRFLTPATRMELAHSPKGESWCLGGGWVCCIFRDILKGDDFIRFYDRAWQLLKEPR